MISSDHLAAAFLSVHLKETRNSPDLFVCFSFGQPSNRGAILTPAVSFRSAKAWEVRQVRAEWTRAPSGGRRGGLRGGARRRVEGAPAAARPQVS